MPDFDQKTVNRLLDKDDAFRHVYEKHSALNAKVDQVNCGKLSMEQLQLEMLKKEKLLLRDRMQAMIQAQALRA